MQLQIDVKVSIDGQFFPLQVSVAMMAKGFVSQMTLVTKEIIAQGRLDAGASISGEMLKNGNLEFVKIWNEARKADEGELEKDPRSVKDQLKDAVGSVTGNAKGKMLLLVVCPASLYNILPRGSPWPASSEVCQKKSKMF